jgi:hypothetical protein
LGDVSTSTAPSLRCPRCSATLRAGTEWCSLCYADLRPREEAPVRPATRPDLLGTRPGAHAGPALPAISTTGAIAPSAPAAAVTPGLRPGGKHAKQPEFGAATAPDPDEVERLAAQLVAELAATEGGLPLGAVSGLVDTTGKRVTLMIGGGLGILLLIVVLMAVAGALL